jgi:putative MATE family efflux protein
VGLTDTYMANHLPRQSEAATAAVGTISYFLWFIGLIVTAIGTGSTALIARAKGARHRSLANSVCGQSTLLALALGVVVGLIIYLAASPLVVVAGLTGDAPELAHRYLRMLAWSVPFSTVMFVANSCLRGAGDTTTPAIAMIMVDGVNMFFTYALTRGKFGLPEMGYDGIAIGTIIAYISGGVLQFVVLLAGRGGIRLHWHRLRPHWLTMKRVFRVGIPSGMEGLLVWIAQFAVLHAINNLDASNVVASSHTNAVRIEGFSYMMGFGVAIATASLVGQSLGARDPRRATRLAYMSYLVGGGVMALWGIVFIFFGRPLAQIMSPHPDIQSLTTRCLFITGFVQAGFAASIIFGGALRGAGDTLAVMLLNLASIIVVRLAGVEFVVHVLHGGLAAIWVVLCIELMCRGALMYARFLQGRWIHAKV